jgi:hypothetical protein
MIPIEIECVWPDRRKEREKGMGELILYTSSSEGNTDGAFNASQ